MKKVKYFYKITLSYIAESTVFKLFLVVLLLIAVPTTKSFIDRLSKKGLEMELERELASSNNVEASGVINTSVDDSPIPKSTYEIADGFEDYKNDQPSGTSGSSSGNLNSVIDKSSITGRDLSITEGYEFNPKKDLELRATDKDGSDITNNILIEKNDVDTKKPGTYLVRASIRLSGGGIKEKEFYVTVKSTDLNVSVEVFKAKEKSVKKGENISFDLDLKVSKNHVSPVSIMINGIEYPVYKGEQNIFQALSNKKRYKANIKSEDISGKKEYNLTQIKMSDNTIISTNNTEVVEILKKEAKVKNFTYEEETLSERIKTNFIIDDKDNSSSNIRVEVYRDNNFIENITLDRAENYNVYIPTKANGKYKVKVVADINLTEDGLEQETIYNKVIFEETINIVKIDRTSITGNSIEIVQGDSFDPKRDLNISATDADGNDITNEVVFVNNVDTNIPKEYIVKASVMKKNGREYSANFTVVVKPIAEVENFNPSKAEVVKDEEILLEIELKTEKEGVEAEYAVINGGKYILTKDTKNSSSDVDVYIVKLSGETSIGNKSYTLSKIIMKDGKEIVTDKVSTVKVIKSITMNNNSDKNRLRISSDIFDKSSSKNVKSIASKKDVVSGDDTKELTASVVVEGMIDSADGTAPDGKISVEIPTSMNFMVDKAGKFKTASYIIENKSSCEIEVFISDFKETKVNAGITVKPEREDISTLDRSNIHLKLVGDQSVDLGEKITEQQRLVDIKPYQSSIIQLVGDAGKGTGTAVDEKGVSEDFNVLFRIKRKN